ncbi:ATP-binding protein [Isoptericola sp. G70]|uniref:ATP-binding protein n=1 Tax=Isoptericola sp. G70 TaxID=3376633 RepID=UPI003A808AD7
MSETTTAPAVDAALTPTPHPGQWRLERVELVNWGTFHGHHRIDVARQGFLLTGASGSGKSSLVDAITAVLTPRGKTRFNAAAADATTRAGDRTVLSYVRGAWRRGTDADTGEIATQYLRPGATWSAIALRYGDGTHDADGAPRTATLIKLFHVKRGANSLGDVQDVHVLSPEPVDVLDVADLVSSGLDVRGLKKRLPGAHVDAEHSRFVARYSRLFGISGDRAVLLLHKTQSAKNLGSLDDLFRTFMLDEPATFATRDRAVEQFTDLSRAHQAVVEAREQIAVLDRLPDASTSYDDAGAAQRDADELAAALEDFTQTWKLDLARQAADTAADDVARATIARDAARAGREQADLRRREAQGTVDDRGGAELSALTTRIEAQELSLQVVTRGRDRLARDLDRVGIAAPTSAEDLHELQRAAQREAADADAADAEHQARAEELWTARTTAAGELHRIEREIQALRGNRSNMGHDLTTARQLICRATGLPASALPFAAELLQVRPEHSDWTGAIERVLRPLATVLLVPAAHLPAVRAAVDATHLGTRLRYEAVPAAVEPPRRPSGDDSLVYRVQVADSPMQAWLHRELARRFDYACVEGPDELAEHERAVTRTGQVRRGRGSFEKDDRFAVHDRSRWLLGFDNADKVDHYLELLRAAKEQVGQADVALGELGRAQESVKARRRVLAELDDVAWSSLDVDAAQTELTAAREARAALLAAQGDLRSAQHLLNLAVETAGQALAVEQSAAQNLAAAQAGLDHLTAAIREMEAVDHHEVPPSVHARLEAVFYEHQSTRRVTHASIDAVSRRVSQELSRRSAEATRARAAAEVAIGQIAGDFARRWPALTGDLTATVEDRGGFLELLGTLRADRLPDFEHRFFDMLRQQSQQNIGLLANEIRRAPAEIKRRVEPINSSLMRSEFAPGSYLQISVEDAKPAAVQEFLRDLATIASGALGEDEDRAEAERRFEVLARVMHRLGSSESADRTWQTLCLDTRRHVRFTGVQVDAEGTQLDVYDSGAGRSGGQKQKLVVFCLAAALRYQLARDAESVPSFGSVVMDEAFDKADAAFTRMALDIFREFGFHMILATPLKLLQTLEEYVGGIAVVQCADSRESSVSAVAFDDVPPSS